MSSPLTGAPRLRERYPRRARRPTAAGEPLAPIEHRQERALCVTIHGAPGSGERMVVCPPLGEEHGHARSVLQRLSARLAEQGHRVVAYDPSGHGDSDGEFSELTTAQLSSDLVTVASHPALGGSVTALIGVRFGAVIASSVIADGLVCPSRLILVEPVLRGAVYARELLRRNVAAQIARYGVARRGVRHLEAALTRGEVVDVDGHLLTSDLYAGLLRCDAVAALNTRRALDVLVDVVTIRPLGLRPSGDVSDLTRLRRVGLHPIEALEPWKEDRRYVVSDVPALAAEVLAVLARGTPPPVAETDG